MRALVPILEDIAAAPGSRSTDALMEIIASLRPRELEAPGAATQRLRAMISVLQTRPHLADGLRDYLSGVFAARMQRSLFADLGILTNDSIFGAVIKRMVAKVLPPAYDDTYLQDLFATLVREAKDQNWIAEIPEHVVAELLEVIGFGNARSANDRKMEAEMIEALRILSFRLAALGLEPDFLRYDSDAASRESPFVAQTDEVQAISAAALAALADGSQPWPDCSHLEVLLSQCERHINRIRKLARQGGASVALTYDAQRAGQTIARMRQLVVLAAPDSSEAQQERKLAFFRELLHHEGEKNSIRALLVRVTDLLALQVTEHASRTGEHYVASTTKEMRALFGAAAGAGVIVAFMAIIKIYTAKAHLPPLWEALGFSLNYGLGFIVVHLLHFTIATKQPAMTAALLAAALDEGRDGKPQLDRLENLVVDVLRSQFAAIVGNVLIAFAVSISIGWLWLRFAPMPMVDAAKATHLLEDIRPLTSLAIPHAAIAGVCLFLSGLITGYYDNKCVYARIPQRIRQLPRLRKLLGEARLSRVSNYIENNLGALMGNFLFGCMLGCMGTIGFILGLPLDIRHVTFGAANFAYGIAAKGFDVPLYLLISCTLGVAAIGLTNLLVSFSLALYTAMKSRRVRFSHGRQLLGRVLKRMLRRPQDLFLPPRRQSAAEET
ncbi:site-specific recombinase [Niveibacterium sp. 24ML]|uniref:site-specific recombinase n=1 Tax=Niveibacterium sp. 24ML TaxID=2985512 RepID=UPI002270F0FD|nr:preprotein translocase subunit TatB [Niveibacterium sp. 24ML]MCX9155253.1 site-specific recombinase [Niveibacterium sp. 24ML]